MLYKAKHKKKQNKKTRLPLRVYLGYLLILTFVFTGVTFSSYITQTGGKDTARVAYIGEISLMETGDFYEANKLMLQPGVDLTKNVILNYTETEITTFIFVRVSTDFQKGTDNYSFSYSFAPEGNEILWKINSIDFSYLLSEEGAHIYYAMVDANASCENKNIIADSGKIEVSEYITASNLKTIASLSLSFEAFAVQANGFTDGTTVEENAKAAWEEVGAS